MNFTHTPSPPRIGALIATLALAPVLTAATLHVAPDGRDTGDGSSARPFATLAWAQAAARALPKTPAEPTTVELAAGTYYLAAPLVLTAADSGRAGAPLVFAAAPGAEVRLTGAVPLTPSWRPWRDGILQTAVPAGVVFDQLFVNGTRQIRARFPNYDPVDPLRSGKGYLAVVDGSNRRPDMWVQFDPATFTAKAWTNPTTGIVHGFQSLNWGNMQYRIAGVDREKNRLLLGAGGWQLQRAQGLGKGRGASSPIYIENILEELDAPGEWFFDEQTRTLYWLPPAGVDAASARCEAVVLKNLIEFRGSTTSPVRHIELRGLMLTAAGLTFLENYEPVSRGDWAIHRGGAVFIEGAEDCRVADCNFDTVGGNAIFLSNYNRRVVVTSCRFFHTGESAVAVVGSPSAVRNYQTWDALELGKRPWISDPAQLDRTPGPQSPDYPADCLVENCQMSEIGDYGKQVAGVMISKSERITVRHCTIHDTARAGININDGTWGGHRIEDCDIWDTIRETGEHGPFNAWGRDRMWLREGGLKKDLVKLDALAPTMIHHNRIANYRPGVSAGSWTIDLDDGASFYEITDNLSLGSTLKLRDGFFRTVSNNIFVSPVPVGFHVWPEQSDDRVTSNIIVVAGSRPGERRAEVAMIRPVRMTDAAWAAGMDRNNYWNANTGKFIVEKDDWAAWQARGFDRQSVFADPRFVDPANGDYRVRADSPALALGFRNFPMTGFGHHQTRLAPLGGEFAGTVSVTFSADARGGDVHYTVDGTEPTARSPRAIAPLTLSRRTTVKARTFRAGLPVGFTATAAYAQVATVKQPTWLTALVRGADATLAAPRTANATHAWRGAQLRPVAGDGDLIDATGGLDFGLFVQELPPDEPAAQLGLQRSDVIVLCNGMKLIRWADFEPALALAGTTASELVVRRNQTEQRLTVPPAQR